MNVPVNKSQITRYGDAAHATITAALREKMAIARSRRDSAQQCVDSIGHAIQILNRIALDVETKGESPHFIDLSADQTVSFIEIGSENGSLFRIHSGDSLNWFFPVEASKEWLKANPETLPEADYFLLEAIDQWGIVSFDDADCETITFTKGQLVKLIHTAVENIQSPQTERVTAAFNAAIQFTLKYRHEEGLAFLDDWNHGEWERIARDWPDFNLITTGNPLAIQIADMVTAEKQAEHEKIRAEEMRDE